jgi:hypothetical protein
MRKVDRQTIYVIHRDLRGWLTIVAHRSITVYSQTEDLLMDLDGA